jgi:glucose-6-phosphate-specific signal transduction histidine kinase
MSPVSRGDLIQALVSFAVTLMLMRRRWKGDDRRRKGMIIALYIVAAVIMTVGSLYFAWQNRDFRKFLAGAFFVSSGILFYLYLADVSVPLLGTSFVETPQISGGRSIVHFILFLLCFYFGFVHRSSGA